MSSDRYEMLDEIGAGGMATVWRARDVVLDRVVAIKRPNEAPPRSTAAARFAREARAAAAVAHPHLVAVHDAGVDDIGPYLVMELIDGPSLAGAKVSLDHAARIGRQAASALAALHASGIVHGDVKPGNILLSPDGAKLSDFGIARAAEDTVTQPGVTFATPAYAAPEALSQGQRTASADVYSLAATLHELVTGSRWNTAAGSTQVMPPGEWAQVLLPALSVRPAERPTASELSASLARLEGSIGSAAPTVPMPAPAPSSSPIAHRRSSVVTNRWGTAIAVLFAVGALLFVLVAVLGSRDRDALTDAASPDPAGSSAAATTTAPSSARAPSTTAATATSAPTLAPSPPPSSPAPASAIAAELVSLVEAIPPDALKPKERRDLVKRIDEVVRVAGEEPGATDKKLREAAGHLGKNLEDPTVRTTAAQLLSDLATSLGLPASDVIAAFEQRR